MKGSINSGYLTKHIAWIEFSNPKKRNALSLRMWKNLHEVIQKLKKDKTLRVLIVRGEGKSFSAGGDISEFKTIFSTPHSSQDFSTSINKAFFWNIIIYIFSSPIYRHISSNKCIKYFFCYISF